MSAHGRVILKPLAVHDLGEQFEYLSDQSLELALRFLDSAWATLDWLLGHPAAGTPYIPLSSQTAGIRRWPIRNFPKYLVYYLPNPEGIDILRVLHGARDVDTAPMDAEG